MKPPSALMVALAAQLPLALIEWPLAPHPLQVGVGGFLIGIGIAINVVSDRLFARLGVEVCPFGETPRLITTGPYRISRNPMYVGLVLVVLGASLLSGLVANAWTAAAYALWLHFVYVLPEEAFLRSRFGDRFRGYTSVTPQWILFNRATGEKAVSHELHSHYRLGRATVVTVVVCLLGAVALMWAWNSVAVDLFHGPTLRFTHALAIEVGLAILVVVPAITFRFVSQWHIARSSPANNCNAG